MFIRFAIITCQNFQFWQVCSSDGLLLAKISLKFCKYVRLTVCYLPKFSILASMFVWRFVRLFVCPHGPCGHDTGRTVWPIITKLDTNMDPWSGQKPIVFLGQRSNNWVTRSRNRSEFKIAITLSIFKLECRSKAQNVGHAPGFPDKVLNFRWHFRRKSSPQP